jgi:Uma2 family endonuclease
MTLKTESQYYTIEQYLALEAKAEEKHEYLDGEIVLMTGGTTNHNTLALNFASYINLALKKQNYRVFMEGLKSGFHNIEFMLILMLWSSKDSPFMKGREKQ